MEVGPTSGLFQLVACPALLVHSLHPLRPRFGPSILILQVGMGTLGAVKETAG